MPLNAKKRNWKKSKTTACKNGFLLNLKRYIQLLFRHSINIRHWNSLEIAIRTSIRYRWVRVRGNRKRDIEKPSCS